MRARLEVLALALSVFGLLAGCAGLGRPGLSLNPRVSSDVAWQALTEVLKEDRDLLEAPAGGEQHAAVLSPVGPAATRAEATSEEMPRLHVTPRDALWIQWDEWLAQMCADEVPDSYYDYRTGECLDAAYARCQLSPDGQMSCD
jgi:hypothetical protein